MMVDTGIQGIVLLAMEVIRDKFHGPYKHLDYPFVAKVKGYGGAIEISHFVLSYAV